MNNKEEVRDIAVRSISSMPLIRSMGATIQKGDRAEYESLVRISVSMNRIAATLGSIFNALRQFVRTNDALINKQRYSDLEAMREAGRSGEEEDEKEPLKKALLSGVGKALLGAALIGLMGLLLPEEIRKNLKDYATNFLMEFDLIKNAVTKFEESLEKVKGFFDSLTNFFDPLKDLIAELGMLVGLSLLCMRRGPTTTVPGGRSTPRAPAGRGGGRAGMLAGVIAAIAGASAASELSEEDKSYFDSIKEWVKEAMSITGDDEETQAPAEGASVTTFNSTISPNAQTAFNFFTGKGYTPEQAAGIVGNLMAESTSNLNIKAFNKDEQAYGIAQWRMDRLEGLGKQYSKDPKETTLDEQLRYIEHELDSVSRFKGIKKQLQESKNSDEAAQIFRDKYEVSKGPLNERQNFAKQVLNARQQPAATTAPATPAAPAPASNTSNTSSNTSSTPTRSLASAAVATPSIGTAIATQSVTNTDMKNTPAGQTNVTNMTAPATTAGAPKSQPNSKPRIPSPVFGSPELSMSLFYEPSMT